MLEANLSEDETRILNTIRARQMIKPGDSVNIDNLVADVIDGRRINLQRGALGLVKPGAVETKKKHLDFFGKFLGEEQPMAKISPIVVAV